MEPREFTIEQLIAELQVVAREHGLGTRVTIQCPQEDEIVHQTIQLEAVAHGDITALVFHFFSRGRKCGCHRSAERLAKVAKEASEGH